MERHVRERREKREGRPEMQAWFFVMVGFILLGFGVAVLNVAFELAGIVMLLLVVLLYSSHYEAYKNEREMHGVRW